MHRASLLLLAACGRVDFEPTLRADGAMEDGAKGGMFDPDLVLDVRFDEVGPILDHATGTTLPCASCPVLVDTPRGSVAEFSRARLDCVQVPDDTRLRPEAFTFMLWMLPNDAAGANMPAYGRPVPGAGSDRNTRELYVTTSGALATIVEDHALSAGIQTGWHHLAATYDGTTHAIFLDGVPLEESVPSPVSYAPGAELIGCDLNGDVINQHYDGLLDDVRLYSRALTANEIRTAAGI